MAHAKFHFNRLILTLILGIRASETPGPGERLKRPGLKEFNTKMELHDTPTSKLAEIKAISPVILQMVNKYTANDICKMTELLVDNIYHISLV